MNHRVHVPQISGVHLQLLAISLSIHEPFDRVLLSCLLDAIFGQVQLGLQL